jgi:hypothetical protein
MPSLRKRLITDAGISSQLGSSNTVRRCLVSRVVSLRDSVRVVIVYPSTLN